MRKTLIIQNEINELNQLAQFIEKLGEELQLPQDWVFNLNLVLEEAVSNIILYAYPEQETHEIGVQVDYDGRTLVFTLTDTGKLFDPTRNDDVDITLSAEERPIGGLGIFLIREIMDEVIYQRIDGRNVLTLKRSIKKR